MTNNATIDIGIRGIASLTNITDIILMMGSSIKAIVFATGIFPKFSNVIECEIPLFPIRDPTTKKAKVNALSVRRIGVVDKGCEKPRIETISLTNNPINITSAILKPTEYKMRSNMLFFTILRTLRKTNPGTNSK